MGSWWRSEDMTYISLIVSEGAAHSCIRELGVIGCCQFTDLNPELTPFQRRYVSYIKRCDEIERKIRYIYGETEKLNVQIASAGTIENFIENSTGQDYTSGTFLLESIESKLESFEKQLIDLNKFRDKLASEYQNKVEYHHLLVKAQRFLHAATDLENRETERNLDEGDDTETGMSLSPLIGSEERTFQGDEMSFANIAGVLPSGDRVRFERMLYRASRGNCYVRFSPLSSKALSADGQPIDKVCFIIFYKSSALETKIKKICDAFSASRYDLSRLNRPQELDAIKTANYREIADAKKVLDRNNQMRERLCLDASQSLEEWLWIVRREKSVYHTLNLFKNDVASGLLRGGGWVLSNKLSQARSSLKRAHAIMNLSNTAMLEEAPESAPSPNPPTHFNLNAYTYAFQEFVNTYGVPRYKEANPALFTAATFPFFFGVMYGDIGHGTCLLLFGLFLILTEQLYNNRKASENTQGIYSARYMLFAMGVMSVYAGLVYNDFFSLGLNLFGSRYEYLSEESGAPATALHEYGSPSQVYPFGVDPAWHISSNELLFFNSMKMKMSVILGIVHMTFGILLRGINALYFRSTLDLLTEFLPMIIFDIGFFGYMIVLIFVKWSINWDERMALGSCAYDSTGTLGACSLSSSSSCYSASGNVCDSTTPLYEVCTLGYGGTSGGCQPPNLITTLINIVLKPGNVDEPMFAGQASIQTAILLVAFLCVPWLLLAKPLYLRHQHSRTPEIGSNHSEHPLLSDTDLESSHSMLPSPSKKQSSSSHGHDHGHGHGESFDFGEVFIHQAIETIEFVLGMVSNTASYLRLWALSLAHTELAQVFWEKAMLSAIETGNPFFIVIGFAIFAAVTFAVLLAMDVLECFLHALRLHWVEFQNKFYRADGYRFQPFDFQAILEKTRLD